MKDFMASTEALLRVKAIENILIKSGVTTQEELSKELSDLFDSVAKNILQKANVPGDIDSIIKTLREIK